MGRPGATPSRPSGPCPGPRRRAAHCTVSQTHARRATHMLSPRRIYSPSGTSSTPASALKMRSTQPERMILPTASNPRSVPRITRPSCVMSSTCSAAVSPVPARRATHAPSTPAATSRSPATRFSERRRDEPRACAHHVMHGRRPRVVAGDARQAATACGGNASVCEV